MNQRLFLGAALVALSLGTVWGQSRQRITHSGSSPRIQRLSQEIAGNLRTAIDEFSAEISREHTPIVEPIPSDSTHVLVTFIWKGDANIKSVQVLGEQMERLPATEIWYATFTIDRDLQLAYAFSVGKEGEAGGQHPMTADPLNPVRAVPPNDQERPESARKAHSPVLNASVLRLPGAPDSPWTQIQQNTPLGRVEEKNVESKVFGRSRRVWVYTPPGYEGDGKKTAGMLICLWGNDYLNEIPVPTILDNLIAQGKIPPVVAVFVNDDGDRFQNIEITQQMTGFLADELIPWVRKTWNVPADPHRTIVSGYSAAGLAATFVAYKRADSIGNVLAQSGAFWRGFEGDDSGYEWLARNFGESPKLDIRFFIEVGALEDRRAAGDGPVFRDANRRLRDTLLRKGYAVSYREVPGADHEYLHWRSQYGDGLIYLMAGWNTP